MSSLGIAARLAGLNLGVAGIHAELNAMNAMNVARSAGSASTPSPSSLEWGFGRKLSGQLAQTASQSVFREIEYLFNARGTTIMPPLEELINLWNGGYFNAFPEARKAFNTFCLMHGADFTNAQRTAAGGHERQVLWGQLLQSKKPRYPTAFLRKLLRQGNARVEEQLRDALKQEGFWETLQQDLYINEWEPLGVHTVLSLWRQGIIDNPDEVRSLLRILGYRDSEINSIMSADNVLPDVGLACNLRNLGFMTDGDLAKSIRNAGYQDGETRDYIKRLRFTPPGAAELLQIAGTRIVVPNVATRWLANAGPPQWYTDWMRRLGYDYTMDSAAQYGTTDQQPTWSNAIWDSHWQLPDIGMMASFLHRFRGDPNNQATWTNPQCRPLSYDEASDLLTANGIAEPLKPYIFNLMYAPLNLRHIQLIVGTVGATPEWIANALQDNGISPAQSQILASAYVAKAQLAAQKPLQELVKRTTAKLVSVVQKAYESGTIDNATANQELVANGIPQGVALTMLATVDVEVADQIVRSVTQRTKSDYLSGRITAQEGTARLIGAGIAAARVRQLVSGWIASFSERRQHLATDKVLSYVRKGFITRDAAVIRLTNLGWTGPDMLLLLADVSAQIAADASKAIAATESKATRETKAAVSLLKRLEASKNQLVSRIRTLTPKAELLKWYVAGLWSESAVREQLSLQGYDDNIIDTMLLQALGEKGPHPPKKSEASK